jgi:hypothetical protein
MACYVSHELPADFSNLPESQAGKGRHICAGCAYDLGRRHAAEAEERLRERVRSLTAQVNELKSKLAAK